MAGYGSNDLSLGGTDICNGGGGRNKVQHDRKQGNDLVDGQGKQNKICSFYPTFKICCSVYNA